MSRGFVKEGDQEDVPLVPPRADLPENTENLVTPAGMEDLLNEREALIAEIELLDRNHEKEFRIAFNFINAKLILLNERTNSAKIIDGSKLPKHEVHFGAKVTFKNTENGNVQTFQIVGVDEANIAKKKIAFTTPLAKALLYKKVGQITTLELNTRKTTLEIIAISY